MRETEVDLTAITLRGTAVPESACPACTCRLDRAATLDQSVGPSIEGELSMCAECGALLMFGPDMQMEVPPAALVAAFAREAPEEFALMKTIQSFIRARRS